MGIISSLFKSAPAAPTISGQPVQVSELPSELKPYYKDILGKAQALYDKRVEEGYQAYKGPTIAKLTPEQEQAYTGIAALQGQAAPKFAEAEALTRQGGADITGAEIQEAMSPYQQAVTDIEKRQSQREFEQNVLPKIRASQVAQGSFGGTRGTLLEAQSLGDQQRLLGDIQAKGSQSAFADARRALEAQRNRSGQAGSQLSNIAPLATKTISGEIGLQQAVGEDKQRYSQAALDEAYRQFQSEQQEPYDAMQKYQSVVTGAPIFGTQYAAAQPQPSLGQTLIGGLGTAIGAYGAFGGLDKKGKTGGGISSLPIIKQANGSQGTPIGFTPILDDKKNIRSGTVKTVGSGRNARLAVVNAKGNVIGVPSKGSKEGDVLQQYKSDETGNIIYRPKLNIKKQSKKFPEDIVFSADQSTADIIRKFGVKPSKYDSSSEDALTKKLETGLGNLRKYNKDEAALIDKYQKGLGSLPTTEQAQADIDKFYTDKEGRIKQDEKDDAVNTRRQQFANMAQFFARLGTASPQGSGLQGVVSAGLKAAEQTAPDVIATQTKAQARKEARKDKQEAISDKKRIEKRGAITKDVEKLGKEIEAMQIKGASESKLLDKEIALNKAKAEVEILKRDVITPLDSYIDLTSGDAKQLTNDISIYVDGLPGAAQGTIVLNSQQIEAAMQQAKLSVINTLQEYERQDPDIGSKIGSKDKVKEMIKARAIEILELDKSTTTLTEPENVKIDEELFPKD